MLPRSLTADFNFPAWDYFGRSSGQPADDDRFVPQQGIQPDCAGGGTLHQAVLL